MIKINYARLVEFDKRGAFFAGQIRTYNDILKHYRPFMSDEFLTLIEVKLDELTDKKGRNKDKIRELVPSQQRESLEKCSDEEVA